MSKEKKKKRIRDTKLGQWISKEAPHLLDLVGDLLPDSGGLGVVKNLLSRDEKVSQEEAMAVLDAEVKYQEQVTYRWEADMKGDVKLAQYIRPITLISLMSMFILLAVIDSIGYVDFEVKESYVNLLEISMLTVFGAYFAGRSLEKIKN